MTTSTYEYNYKDCEKFDGRQINAYVEASLDNENPTILNVDSTWGDNAVDLTPAVKAAETVTSLELVPTDNHTSLQFNREDGEVDCISGNDLSRIISMTKLRDVDQVTAPVDGDVYIYDGDTNTFKTFNLSSVIGDINTAIANINNALNQIATLENRVTSLETNMRSVNEKLTPPDGAPDGVKVAFGNIDLYGDSTGADLKTSGIYTHGPNTDATNDIFAE